MDEKCRNCYWRFDGEPRCLVPDNCTPRVRLLFNGAYGHAKRGDWQWNKSDNILFDTPEQARRLRNGGQSRSV